VTVVIVPATALAADVLECLCSWSASALLKPFCWWSATPGEEHPIDVRRVAGGEASTLRLNQALAIDDVRRPRLIAFYPASADEELSASFATAVDERLVVAREVLSFDPSHPVECDLIVAPGAIAQPVPPELFRLGWRTNVYVAPEDRSDPDAASQLLGWDRGAGPHAAHAIATLAGLWIGGSEVTEPVLRTVAETSRQHQGEVPMVQVTRCFSRAVDFGYVADHVAAEVFQAGDAWPNPDRERYERSADAATTFPLLADSYFDKHRRVLGLSEFEPLTLPKPKKYGLVEAFKLLVALVWARMLRKPGEMIDATVGRAYDWAATQIERSSGSDGGIPVRRWKERPEDERSLLDLREVIRQPLYQPDGAVAQAWDDMRALAFGLIDGAKLPSGIDMSLVERGPRRVVYVDPRLIAPHPTTASGEPEGRRACDPLRTPTSDPDDQAAGPKRSLLWLIGRRIAADLREARTAAAVEIEDPTATPEPVAPSKRRWYWPFRRRRARVRRPHPLRWAILRATFLAALGVAAATKYLTLTLQIPAFVAIVMAWMLLVANAARKALLRDQAAQRETLLEHIRLLNAEKLRAQRIGDAARLERRYAEYLDWAEVVGWVAHRPWVGQPLEGIGVPPPIERETLPAALVLGTGVLDETHLKRLSSGARSELFRPAWLTDLYEGLERRIMQDAWLGHAPGAVVSDVNLPNPTADTSDDPELPRGTVVTAMRRGDHRSVADNPLSGDLLGYLDKLRLDALCNGLVVGAGTEPLPPSAAWFDAPPDLPNLAVRLRPTVVRVHATIDDQGYGGTGVIIDPSGLIATSWHVIDAAQQIAVELADGTVLDAEVSAASTTTDLAVLRVTSDEPLPAASLAPAEPLPRQGEPLVTLGHPDLLEGDVTLGWGLVAATARQIQLDRLPPGVEAIDVIQATYHAAGGASGSPVFDLAGNVIAIHCGGSVPAVSERMRDATSFAVPVRDLHELLAGATEPAEASPSPNGTVELALDAGTALTPTRFLTRVDECSTSVSMLPQHWLIANGSERVDRVVYVPDQDETLGLTQLTAGARFLSPIRVLRHRVELSQPTDATELASCRAELVPEGEDKQ
jgi:S1-C subfamily serine protease